MIYEADKTIMRSWMQYERNFKELKTRAFTLVCSCPVCGDSKKDSFQARFRCYEYNDNLRIGCFNCGLNLPIGEFLKEHRPDEFRQWLLERRKEQGGGARQAVTWKPKEEPIPVIQSIPYSERLDTLPENHPIIRYVVDRCIPKSKWRYLWFTMEFQKLANFVKEETFRFPKTEPRLVIPIFNEQGKIESLQGRALRKDYGNAKYMTIKTHEMANKIYGMERADPTKTVWFMEGPIDSLFIDNACAITGGSMGLAEVPYESSRVWALDNEPRAQHTMERLEKLIDAGEKVVLWDRCPWLYKDINDMVQKGGATPEQITQYMIDNTVSGNMAKFRFNRWAKY